jgi:hypothetical protein
LNIKEVHNNRPRQRDAEKLTGKDPVHKFKTALGGRAL